MPFATLLTDRLLLRAFEPDDLEALERVHADSEVAHWLGGRLTREQTAAALDAMVAAARDRDWGMRAVCLPGGRLIGAAGLQNVREGMPFTGVEAAWRLHSSYWGRGYIAEAMRPLIGEGFDRAGLAEIVTFTAVTNERSRRVMARLGFAHDPAGDFDHPRLPEDHPLRRHVFYRLPRARWPADLRVTHGR